MKKTLLAVAIVSTLPQLSYAQSSVTLAGVIDVGINDVTNAAGAHQYMMSSGVNNGSRVIFLGVEDLGGGLKSIFFLENGFNVNNGSLGQGGLLFGRQAYVGLTSGQFSSVTLGRQYDSVVDYVGQIAAADNWGGYISAHPGDLDNLNNSYRVNNSIKYTSPTFGGLTFGGVYSLGGVAGEVSRNQVWSLGSGYANGPLSLGVAMITARNPNLSFFGNNSQTALTAATANGTVTPVYSGYMSARSYTSIGAAAAYTIGKGTAALTYSNVRFSNMGDTSSGPDAQHYTGTAIFNNAEASFRYRPIEIYNGEALANAYQEGMDDVRRALEGWQLAPTTPSLEMIDAGSESDVWNKLVRRVVDATGWPYTCTESSACVADLCRAVLEVGKSSVANQIAKYIAKDSLNTAFYPRINVAR
ncbi:porin [Glaciimonas soli]|uniref:Porin n=1 Tax=Glaciimonas soli TaxID=2590999 RepID=A0A843YTK9_9BURK|nr:porin [Glaciimonas soli]MQR02560.1 porin [Glaciimonas soli]